ncbi:hypothetical protein THOM_0001 [Trachipleistophora hominis]|uniref:Uncharacterized protein n=1 Tax=Trachipleistophora hominis TaxID=72359 RepID=L7JZV8_TRAHO|nr:hypothetical protein THOM_0001 [Trachipleistophora hominis]
MAERTSTFRSKHEALLKQFYITPSSQNVLALYQNAIDSKDDEIVEEFIKLCCISVDRTKFETCLTKIIERFVWLGLKYYDEMVGYEKARTLVEKEMERLKNVIKISNFS